MNRFNAYYQLTKPGIIYGNLINTTAGFLLASKGSVDLGLMFWTLSGTALIIASACVLNNYIDRKIDSKMIRTKSRALASGLISVQNAIIFAVVLGVIGFMLLIIYTNWLTVSLGLLAYFVYIVVYGYAKRHSVHGTLVGSVAGALPPVAGYTAVTNELDVGAGLIFLILVTWQMPHFYSIAIYRYKDYKAAGLPVWPVRLGIASAKQQIILYILAFIVAASLPTVFGYTGITYLFVVTCVGILWLKRAMAGYNSSNDTLWARQCFKFSLIVILIISLMLSVGGALP